MLYRKIAKPILFKMDPERAHHLTIDGLSWAGRIPGAASLLGTMYAPPNMMELKVELCGLTFPNPVGLAAGLDKNGVAIRSFASIGFGFMEVGTVTPKPQQGNELPRVFRLPSDAALINRMGFNNEGIEQLAKNLHSAGKRMIPIAVNIGKNKLTPNELAVEDYLICIRRLYNHGSFFVVNISSPNTPGLRSLQHGDELRELLTSIDEENTKQARANAIIKKPIFVKIAPDLTDVELETMIATIISTRMSGIIATNTTLSREGLTHGHAKQTGGLSGKPLTSRATEVIRSIYQLSQGKLPIIGVGGIFTAEDAYEKIRAGASLIEVYTALVYKGPGVIREIVCGLKRLLQQDGFTHITDAVGVDSEP